MPRLFTALEIPRDAALSLSLLRGGLPGARWVDVENYHLTLAFLGAVAEDAMGSVRSAADNVSAACLSNSELGVLEVTLDQINFWHKPQILCATASRESPLAIELAETLKRHLINAGFTPDLKTFRAHVTLARKVARVKVPPHVEAVRVAFRDFSLVESRSGPGGSIYSVIDSWPLCARALSNENTLKNT